MTIDSHADAARELKMRLVYVFGIVRRQMRLAVLLVLCPILGGVIYYCFTQTVYQSRAQLLVSRSDAPADKLSDELLATHMRLIQSPLVVSRALERTDISQLASGSSRLNAHESATAGVIDRLSITRGGLGQARVALVLDVSYRGDSAIESQRVLTAIIESYHEFLNQHTANSASIAGPTVHGSRVNVIRELSAARSRVNGLLQSLAITSTRPELDSEASTKHTNEQAQPISTAQNLQMIDADSRMRAIDSAVKNLNEVTDRLVQSLPDAQSAKPTGVFTNVVLAMPEPGKYLAPRLSICLIVGSLCGLMLSVAGIFAADTFYPASDHITGRSPNDYQGLSTAAKDHRNTAFEVSAGAMVNGASRPLSHDNLEPKAASESFPADSAP